VVSESTATFYQGVSELGHLIYHLEITVQAEVDTKMELMLVRGAHIPVNRADQTMFYRWCRDTMFNVFLAVVVSPTFSGK
jgi:hypothetical protein